MPLATDSTATIDSEWQSVRNAQMQKIDDDPYCYIGGVGHDLTMAGVHYATASYPTIATRSALAILRRLGLGGGYGPRVTGATKTSPTVYDVAIEHDNGTDITPSSGVTGFKVFDGSTPVTPSSVARQSANTVRITLASPPSGDVTIYNLYGVLPTVTSPVKDNNVSTLPLWPSGPMAVAEAVATQGRVRAIIADAIVASPISAEPIGPVG